MTIQKRKCQLTTIVEHFLEGKPKQYTKNNIYTDGKCIYSYGRHFPIIGILRSPDKSYAMLLFNSDSYSVTTGKHKHSVINRLKICLEKEYKNTQYIWYNVDTKWLNEYSYNSSSLQNKYMRDTFFINNDAKDKSLSNASYDELWETLRLRYWRDHKVKLFCRVNRKDLDSYVKGKTLLRSL